MADRFSPEGGDASGADNVRIEGKTMTVTLDPRRAEAQRVVEGGEKKAA